MKTLLPTSTAGSLPKPVWLAEPETLWSSWKLEGEALIEAKRDALRLSLDDQRRASIDIVSDGDQGRGAAGGAATSSGMRTMLSTPLAE